MRRSYPLSFFLLAACAGAHTPSIAPSAEGLTPTPPVAERHDHEIAAPTGVRNDPYFWLRDDTRKDARVLAYLEAENAYTEAVLAPTGALQETLFAEIKGRVVQDDSTVPTLHRGYWYYSRFEDGKDYPIVARRAGTMDAPEQVLLDVNELARGHDFYALGDVEISPDDRLLAYTEDTVGRNEFALRVLELESRALLPDTAAKITPEVEWSADSRWLFYVAKDPVTLLSDRIYRHAIGATGDDALVYREADTSYYVELSRSKSEAYILVELTSTDTSEVLLIDAARPEAPPVAFYPREHGHDYRVDHLDGEFVVRTNWRAANYRAMRVVDGEHADRAAWRELVPHRDDELLHDLAIYRGFFATEIQSGGLRKVRVFPRDGEPYLLDAEEPAYAEYLVDTPDPDSARVRVQYSSLTTPESWLEVDVASRERTVLKQERVLGDYDPKRYASEHIFVTARDGARVPVSLVYRADTARDGTAPLLQYGYGSYGLNIDPEFRSYRLSLLDRGFVFAIAHVRGSQTMGRAWYEAGRQLSKRNTFDDFIDVTDALVERGYAARDRVFAQGGSAGGLLMGAIVNMAPDKYRGVIADVPFVDVVTTMLDTSIPLTTNEFEEWGDPRQQELYDYMLSYSPYDNVGAHGYPTMMVTTGLWDSQVQYFEPAKWVARLRATKTDANPLLLHTNMDAGHGGKSGRDQRYREIARDFAFLLFALDRPDAR